MVIDPNVRHPLLVGWGFQTSGSNINIEFEYASKWGDPKSCDVPFLGFANQPERVALSLKTKKTRRHLQIRGTL